MTQIPAELNRLTYTVIGCAYQVHRKLGPGLLESVYEVCLVKELECQSIRCQRQVAMPVYYRGDQLNAGYRIDIIVQDELILEIKSVEAIAPVHEAQILTYLRLSGKRLGLILNFNTADMKQGIRRFIMTDR